MYRKEMNCWQRARVNLVYRIFLGAFGFVMVLIFTLFGYSAQTVSNRSNRYNFRFNIFIFIYFSFILLNKYHTSCFLCFVSHLSFSSKKKYMENGIQEVNSASTFKNNTKDHYS